MDHLSRLFLGSKTTAQFKHYVRTLWKVVYATPRIWMGVAIILLATVVVGFQNYHAAAQLRAAKSADNAEQYDLAQKELTSIHQFAVWPSIRKGIHAEQSRNQQLEVVQQQLAEVKQLLKDHKTQAAESLLQSIGKSANASSTIQTQVVQLQNSAASQKSSSGGAHSTTPTTSSPKPASGGGGSTASSSPGGGSTAGTGSGTPPPGPLTAISVTSFTAGATPATASSCTVNDALNFSVNGSGSVTVTWSLLSNKSVSEINNPVTYSFSAPASQNDSNTFSNTQGLEPGDSYRVIATIASVSDSSITATAGPIAISSCASPPPLAAEQESPFMTAITPSTPSITQFQDSIFNNECSIQVTTPYSVNSSGTVEAIAMVTSGDSIGYTYYDTNGATGFTGSGSTSDTSYFRLPHLPSGGNYTITVKLVEVSAPSTVFANTSPITTACS